MAHIVRKKKGEYAYLYIQKIEVLGFLGNEDDYDKEDIKWFRQELKDYTDPHAIKALIAEFKENCKKPKSRRKKK